MTRLVLLGGGHAHAWTLRRLRDYVSRYLEVTLVSPGPLHTYSGMLPGVVAGHYEPREAQIDLQRLARAAGAEFVQNSVLALDPGEKQVLLADGATLSYDVASLNVGSLPNFDTVPGAASYAVGVKPFDAFLARWRQLLERRGEPPRVAVVGGGAAGFEVAMAMQYALAPRGGAVVLYSERNVFPAGVARRAARALRAAGVSLRAGEQVREVEEGPAVVTERGPEAYDAVFWTAGAAAQTWIGGAGLATDAAGYALVDASLRSVSHPDVFAVGDTAAIEGMPLPRAGVYAVRQAAVLAENLKRVVRGAPMLDYEPQREFLVLLACGRKYAIASRGAWSAEGRWAWWWKDWIDRRWIRRFA